MIGTNMEEWRNRVFLTQQQYIQIFILEYCLWMSFFQSCMECTDVYKHSFEENAIWTGASDTIIVKQKSGNFKSTPFLVCFGPYYATHSQDDVIVRVNNVKIPEVTFKLNQKGYITPMYLPDKSIRKLLLNFGVNNVTLELAGERIQMQVYLYTDNDKLIVSDVDGTVTKSDIGGHINNMLDKDYLHDGYARLAQNINSNGYKLVWLTMRALPLYNYSKKYLREMVKVDGPIMMEPEEFFPSFTKEIMKKTGNIKANMMRLLKQLFPSNPFMAGLGNRENDAVAYYHAGIPLNNIFIIDTSSRVQIMSQGNSFTTYEQMCNNIQQYFPPYSAPKIGYK